MVDQNIHTIPTRIHHQQQKSQQKPWNVINNAVIVLFWIYNVFLDLTWYYCDHIVLMK